MAERDQKARDPGEGELTTSFAGEQSTRPPASGSNEQPPDASLPSVLFLDPTRERHEQRATPEFFTDLRLDQIVARLVADREEYDLAPFIHTPLLDQASILYRQEVMRDLEKPPVRAAVDAFAGRMRSMRAHRGTEAKAYYPREKQRWLLAAAEAYADAEEGLARDLDSCDLESTGLRRFRSALLDHVRAPAFTALVSETRQLASGLASIRFGMLVRDASVRVQQYQGEADYSVAVEETFRKFAEGEPVELQLEPEPPAGLSHVDAAILDRVALLEPELFQHLAEFSTRHDTFAIRLLRDFDREVQFYLAWLDLVRSLRDAGLPFCYPALSDGRGDVGVVEAFDLALADRLHREKGNVVLNDFFLRGPERILVVTGPNQGGKTTFARMVGQLHHLARLGVLIPGRRGTLFVCDRIFTHFEREEDVATLHGKLEDDLVRIHGSLQQATSDSLVIMNEIFSSTTALDALFLAREILERISRLDLLCVCVTFLDELATLDAKTVSIVGEIDPNDPSVRTYKLDRRPPNGLAYALALAQKHGLTYDALIRRIGS